MKTKITLNNDTVVECSLGMAAMRSLRAKSKMLYMTASRVILGGIDDDVQDVAKTLYASYIAVNENPMSESEFYALLPDSIQEQCEMLSSIIQQ